MTESKTFPDTASDRVPKLALLFTEESVWQTRFDARGQPLVTYPVAANDIASAFNVASADSGLLPADTLFWQRRHGITRIGIWLPAARRRLTFAAGRRSRTVDIPLPGFVFVGADHTYQIWAARERPVKPGDRLYQAPLPNVYDNGHICQGSAQFPVCRVDTIAAAAQVFFESAFNTHLAEGRINSQHVAEEDYPEDDEGADDDPDEIDPWQVAHNGHGHERRQRRRRRAVNLVQFLIGLKARKSFPVAELIPTITIGQAAMNEGRQR